MNSYAFESRGEAAQESAEHPRQNCPKWLTPLPGAPRLARISLTCQWEPRHGGVQTELDKRPGPWTVAGSGAGIGSPERGAAGGEKRIIFDEFDGSPSDDHVAYDTLTFSPAFASPPPPPPSGVPAPATAILLGLGAIGLALARRRRAA